MDSTSVARQRIPLVVYKLSVPHCSPDCRPLLVLIRRPHCQSTPLPHLVHTIRTTHSSVCGNVAHHSGECCTPHRGMLHATPVMLRTTPGNVAHHTGECCTPHRTGRSAGRHVSTCPLFHRTPPVISRSHHTIQASRLVHELDVFFFSACLLAVTLVGYIIALPTCCHWLKQRLTSLHTG